MTKKPWMIAKKILSRGGIAVVPVDTKLYGLVAKASNKSAVGEVYAAKGRSGGKACIILFTAWSELEIFGIALSPETKKTLNQFWPGKVSVILACPEKEFDYLHRGNKSLAFRMVGKRNAKLFDLLKGVGPLIAPSANPEGLPPAETITQAKKYFGERVDAYVRGGRRNGQPSTLIEIKNDSVNIIRQGAGKV